MPTVHVHHPHAPHPVALSLGPGDAVLLGRAPDPSRLAHALDGWQLTTITLDDDAVSSNHLLVWCNSDGVWAQDLSSRNGTWARLSARPLQLTGTEIRIDLAGVRIDTSDVTAALPSPAWTGHDDFTQRMSAAIETWLADQGIDVLVAPSTNDPGSTSARFALATGVELEVQLAGSGTLDLRFPRLMEDVARFVETQNALLDQESGHDEGFVLRSPAFREAHRRVCDAAARGHRLLLLGASGTGKDRLAECYHRHSPRRDGPFKAINCALVDRSLIWAQLFGAKRASFTGATDDVKGAVEAAHGGTLFLDEVGELDATTQSALLRFLDRRGEYERLGDPKTRHADVLIVCATNRDLREAVRNKRFREDLWYRFAGAVVEVPLLRDRPEDLRAFLASRRVSRVLSVWDALAPDALDLLLRYSWPGNFRELDNMLQRLPAVTHPGAIDRATCERALREGLVHEPSMPPSLPTSASPSSHWNELLTQAAGTWREDHDGADPETLGDIRDFVESYLKPVFAAHASGVAQGAPIDGLNWSALGRRLAVADGSTVKRWVERYLARFRR